MTILQSLVALYDRLDRRGEAPKPGYAPVRIAFVMELDNDGTPLGLIDIRNHNERKPVAPALLMPAVSRTSGIKPAFLWDKTAYVFGVIGLEELSGESTKIVAGQGKRTLEEHSAFRSEHIETLKDANDPGLTALKLFLERWSPDQWTKRGYGPDALDANIAFRLKGDDQRIDERQAARTLVEQKAVVGPADAMCLVTGEVGPFAPLQPQFKGVTGAQSSGAPLVSFNADAFESYDRKSGANAPVSESAAFKYGAALNWLLDRNNARRFRLGETTVVFWADEKEAGVGEEAATEAEKAFWAKFGNDAEPEPDADAEESGIIGAELEKVKALRGPPDLTKVQPNTRVHVLGLSPNAGRIAVRFWLVDTFGHLETNLARHKRDLAIEPPDDRNPNQKAYALLYEIAVLGKAENIPPRLGGELARAILTGVRYPRTLLSAVINRIRADKEVNAARAGLCKAIINRDHDMEVIPVALDPQNPNPAYRLGRLFALIEGAQKAALPKLNATVKDRFFGAACATPARVFPLLHKNAMNHIAAVRKERGGGLAHWLEAEIGQIWSGLSDDLPRALRLEEQGRFIAGYYHQRFSRTAATPVEAQTILASDTEGDDQ
jgi:CRISPR-associated protein Csd1